MNGPGPGPGKKQTCIALRSHVGSSASSTKLACIWHAYIINACNVVPAVAAVSAEPERHTPSARTTRSAQLPPSKSVLDFSALDAQTLLETHYWQDDIITLCKANLQYIEGAVSAPSLTRRGSSPCFEKVAYSMMCELACLRPRAWTSACGRGRRRRRHASGPLSAA